MQAEESSSPAPADIRASIVLTAAVILTVFLALFLAASDQLLVRLPPPLQPQPTAVAAVISITPLPTVAPLPSDTPTPTPTPTASPRPRRTSTPTAVPIIVERTCGNVPDGWVAYRVRTGDTVFRLAVSSGATASEIVQANCLESGLIYTGTTIYLPRTPPVRPPCGPPLSWVRHTVQAGETLFSLARTQGTTVYAIMQANCLVNSKILAGRQLFLPQSAASATPLPAPAQEPDPPPPPPPPPPPAVTPTNTVDPPTATNTPDPPPATPTDTPAAPTITPTPPPLPPTETPTNAPLPPTATSASSPAPPTAAATDTPVPPTKTTP